MLEDTPQCEQTWHLIKMPPLHGAEALIRLTALTSVARRVQQALKALFYFYFLFFFSTSAITSHTIHTPHHVLPLARSRHLPKGLIVAVSFLSSLEDQVWTSKWFHIRRQLRFSFQDVQSRCSGGFSAQLLKKCLKTIRSTFLQQCVKCVRTDGQTIQTPPLLWQGVSVCVGATRK